VQITPVILATWVAEMGKIEILGQHGQITPETPSPKQPEQNELEMRLKPWSDCFASTKP
jgi:hypothetical protein